MIFWKLRQAGATEVQSVSEPSAAAAGQWPPAPVLSLWNRQRIRTASYVFTSVSSTEQDYVGTLRFLKSVNARAPEAQCRDTGVLFALEMRDFLTKAGVTHLENVGFARGTGPVQQKREARRRKTRFLSMHSSNPKVRNSPSGNAQSSPKSKQEVMVRPPTVMSPSGNPQLDSKFSNQGKQGGSTGQSQPSPCDPKSGAHTPKVLPGQGGNMGLKNGAGNGSKGKGKRERSISADSFEQRDAGTPSDESEMKELGSAEHTKSQDASHTTHSMVPSNSSVPRSSTPSHGQTTTSEPGSIQKTPSKVVYVFSTDMANKAAEAVLKGQVETIVSFHIQNISNKAERNSVSLNTQLPPLRNDSKPQVPSQLPISQEQTPPQNAKMQQTPPIPVPAPAPKSTSSSCPIDQDNPGLERIPPQMATSRELEFGIGPSSMKGDVNLNVNMTSNPSMLPQKMREAGMGPEEIMKMRTGVSEMLPSQQKMVPLPFGEHPQQDYGIGPRPFHPMSQGPVIGLRNHREQIGPDQRTNNRLSHMPPLPLNASSNPNSLNTTPPVQRNLGRKPLDVSVGASQVHSPGINPLKSPTMRQVQSPMLGSPSGNLKSPQTPSQLAGILAGPTTVAAAASIKSPPVMGSAAASPVHLKSPSLPAPSPGWTSSPKPPLQSPGIPPNHKASLAMSSPAMMGNVESGGAPPSTVSQNVPVTLSGNLPSSSPYTIPPEPTLSQNPLSIMMSRMSKFAMPSSTPLYHDAIKTVASSDDDSPPARSPNLPSINNLSGMGINPQNPRLSGPNQAGSMATLSPMGMTQPLTHSNQLPSPNAMGANIPPHGVPVGPGLMSHNPMMGHGSQDPPMVPQGRLGFPQGFPPVQSPPQQVPFPHNGPGGGQGNFPAGMSFHGEGPLGRPTSMPQSSTDPALWNDGRTDSKNGAGITWYGRPWWNT
ncbi:B-cell CLL/lymphoma 9 protein [Crotalus adamanteus]|uniref:B-cell CLL/lymphoma 9 protein n=1 Tax=Crotalus adamanteus TaxID=8729 RepID=A0AAW1BKY0_CROAD